MTEYRPDESGPPKTEQEERISQLEAQVSTLADAIRALAKSLERIPIEDVSPMDEAARGARMAHEILLSRNL